MQPEQNPQSELEVLPPPLKPQIARFLLTNGRWWKLLISAVVALPLSGVLASWIFGSGEQQKRIEEPTFSPQWVLEGGNADLNYFATQMQLFKWSSDPANPGQWYRLVQAEANRMKLAIDQQRITPGHHCFKQSESQCLDRVEQTIEAEWKKASARLDYAGMSRAFFRYEAVQDVRAGNVTSIDTRPHLFIGTVQQFRKIRNEFLATYDAETQAADVLGGEKK